MGRTHIRFGDGTEAILENGRWHSDDPLTLELMEALMDEYGPSGSDADHDVDVGLRVAKALEAEVVEVRAERSNLPPGAIP
jgi:hypothetical protein